MFNAMPAGPEHPGWKMWEEIGVKPRPCACPPRKSPFPWIFLTIALLYFVVGLLGFESGRPTLAVSHPIPRWEFKKPKGPDTTSGHGYYLRREERGRGPKWGKK